MASTKKKRGAKASRSSFRAKPKTEKTSPKPATRVVTAKKPAAKKPAATKPPPKKPAAKKPAAKKPPPKKPAAKKSATTKSATTKSAAKKPTATESAAKPAMTGQKRTNPAAGAKIPLGEIMVPSGMLAIFDVGLVGYLPREALEPAIIKIGVPADRSLRVIGVPVGTGRFSDCWDHVSILIGDGEPHTSRKLGEAGVDFARLILIDHAALDHWQHEDSLDGKADFVFWGRDEAALARVLNAPKVKEGYGWTDLTIADAEAKADRAANLKSENNWAFAADYRPHTHHYHALAVARASKHGAGTLELAGTQLMLLFTSWGDGVFPIYLELDADDQPVAVRIQLATEASNAAMRAVNP